uniref:Uncharacterized protein n=1 Tax=Arundo donax TaxID=35708 RepID=A0A0A9AZ76_ARUDO
MGALESRNVLCVSGRWARLLRCPRAL